MCRPPTSAGGHRRPAVLPRAVAAVLLPICGAAPPAPALADSLPPPGGEVLLVISGDIAEPNVGEEAHIDRDHLATLPRERFTTDTPWSTDGPHEFEGVRLSALLDAVGADRNATFEAFALDDYAATFENVDLERYPVILADTRDGVPLTVRRLGPLRIMFPFDQHPELRTQTNMAIAVWQLVAMEVR